MKLIEILKDLREKFLRKKVQKIKLPEFNKSEIVRKKLIFSGKVQNVGFRLETDEMANRLKLRGFVKNREDGKVEAEVEGEEEKIRYLINHLKSVKRIEIESIDEKCMEVRNNEKAFGISKNKLKL